MNPLQWIRRAIGGGKAPRAKAAMRRGASGRASYAAPFAGLSTLPRVQSFQLLTQLYDTIPAMKRSATLLSGLAGCPSFVCSTSSATEELNAWAESAPYGFVGLGLGAWLDDLRRQKLVYGYAVGEAEITPSREVGRLWSYSSRTVDFRPDAEGAFEIVQHQPGRGLVPLRDETSLLIVHDPTGCNPHGESQYLAMPSFGTIWADMAHQHHQTWMRSGTPRYHVSAEPLDGTNFDDPDGTEGASVLDELESDWNEAMRKTVVDGTPQDYFSWGKVTVTTIGHDNQALDIKAYKVPIVEEIAVCTDLPPFMLGYSWSSTERMSTQQADALTSRIKHQRREDEGAVRKLVALRQQLRGVKDEFDIVWPQVNLQDRKEQSMAEYYEAQAAKIMQAVRRQRWQDGILRQRDYAEEETGSSTVYVSYPGPQALAGAAAASGGSEPVPQLNAFLVDQLLEEYPELRARCNGRH